MADKKVESIEEVNQQLTSQTGYQFNPCWSAVENYGAFRKAMGIASGDALTFHQWMQFADACFRAGQEAGKMAMGQELFEARQRASSLPQATPQDGLSERLVNSCFNQFYDTDNSSGQCAICRHYAPSREQFKKDEQWHEKDCDLLLQLKAAPKGA